MENYVVKISGKSVDLCLPNYKDAAKFVEWLNDSEVTECISMSTSIVNQQMEEEYLKNCNTSSSEYTFTIVTKFNPSNINLIGSISLRKINYIHRRAELGIMIGDKNSRSKGYGTEAINLLLGYAFNSLNLNTVSLTVLAFNTAAIKSYEKVGFNHAGRLREARYSNGKYHDIVIMDITKNDFERNNTSKENVE